VPRHDHGGSEPLLQTQPTMHHWYPEPLTFEVAKHEADKQCGGLTRLSRLSIEEMHPVQER
jgi:hypothetical protein